MSKPRLLAFAGSARAASVNRKLIAVVAEGARAAGAEVTQIELGDYPLPIYDGELEARDGLPSNALKLKQLFREHDGVLIACPEYNSSITPLLKNTIDWVSRKAADEKPLACYEGKVCGLVAASPGALGGLRGLVTVRMILGNLRMLMVPEQVALVHADKAFDGAGQIVDEKQRAAVHNVGAAVARLCAKLKA